MTEVKRRGKPESTTLKTVNDKLYIVKSFFDGDKNVKDLLLDLAEKKTLREMGLAYSTP